jgi:hypothetical protein
MQPVPSVSVSIRKNSRRGGVFTTLIAAFFIILFCGAYLGGTGVLLYCGTRDVLLQRKLLDESQPVSATIVSRSFESRTSKSKTRYYPTVRFSYAIDGKTYESDRLTPLNYRGQSYSTSSGATQFLDATYPEDAVQAYYLPGDPTLAYLRREAQAGCYVMTAGGIALATPLLWLLLNLKQTQETRDAKGRQVFKPGRSLGKRKLDNAVIFLAATAANGLLAWHYFSFMPGPHGPLSFLAWSSVLVLPLLALFGFVRAYFIAGVVGDVTVTADDFKPGKSSTVIVEQDVLGFDTSTVEKVRISMKCVKTTGTGKQARSETVYNEGTDYPANVDRNAISLAGGKRLRIEGVVTLPSSAPVTTPSGHITFAWTLNVRTSLLGKPDYVFDQVVKVAGWQ